MQLASWLDSYVQCNDMYATVALAMYYLKSLMLQLHSPAANNYFRFISLIEQQFIMCV